MTIAPTDLCTCDGLLTGARPGKLVDDNWGKRQEAYLLLLYAHVRNIQSASCKAYCNLLYW